MEVSCQCLWLVQQKVFFSPEINEHIFSKDGYGESQWLQVCLEKEQQIWINQHELSHPLVLEGGSTYFVIKLKVLFLAFMTHLNLAQTNFNFHFSTNPSCYG